MQPLGERFGCKCLEQRRLAPRLLPPGLLPNLQKPTPAPKAQSNSAGSGLETAQTLDTESQEPATPTHDFEEHATETQSVVSIQRLYPQHPLLSPAPVASLRGSQQGAAASSSGLKRPASKMEKNSIQSAEGIRSLEAKSQALAL